MLRQYIWLRTKDRTIFIFLSVLTVYTLAGCIDRNFVLAAGIEAHPTLFSSNQDSFFSPKTFAFVFGLFFLILIRSNHAYFSKSCVLVRIGSFQRCWRMQMLLLLAESAVYVLTLYLFLLLRAAYFQLLPDFARDWREMIQCALLQIIGYFWCSFLFALLSSFLRSAVAGFGITYLLMVADYFVFFFSDKGSFSTRFISVIPGYVGAFVPKLLISLLLVALLILFASAVLGRRDYLTKEVA